MLDGVLVCWLRVYCSRNNMSGLPPPLLNVKLINNFPLNCPSDNSQRGKGGWRKAERGGGKKGKVVRGREEGKDGRRDANWLEAGFFLSACCGYT